MDALSLTGNALHKAEVEYHGNFGHTIGRIQHISLMIRIDLCYATCYLAPKYVASTLPVFQGINSGVQYLASHPHKPIFYPSNYHDVSYFIRLTCSGNQFDYHTAQNCL